MWRVPCGHEYVEVFAVPRHGSITAAAGAALCCQGSVMISSLPDSRPAIEPPAMGHAGCDWGTGSPEPNLMHSVVQLSCCSQLSSYHVWQAWVTTATDGPGGYAFAKQFVNKVRIPLHYPTWPPPVFPWNMLT